MKLAQTVTSAPTPAYVSYKTFVNFLRRFKDADTGLPAQIDRSVLGNMSGATQSMLLGALEFLRLTDGSGHVTGKLTDLVAAVDDKNKWETEISHIYEDAYAPILGSMDLTKATGNMLRKAFKEHGGTEGSTAVKSISFCLRLAKEAGATVSPHIKITPPRVAKTTKKVTTKREKDANDESGGRENASKVDPPGQSLLGGVHPIIGGIVQSLPLPGSAMTELQRKNFEATFGMALKLAYRVATKEEESG